MIEKEHFKRPIYIDINVSTIGINKDDWYCHKPGMNQEDIKQTMLLKGYDVVPIINKAGKFKDYLTIDRSNQNKLITKKIETEDKLYYLTHVRDAIWKMKTNNRTHYFLTNGRNENEVVGLLSLSNLNCREFYVYLFSLLSYVEKEFSNLIESDFKTGFDILEKHSTNNELNSQLQIIKKRYNEDVEKKNENDYKEYLYLHHLIWLIKEESKFKNLLYSRAIDFESGTSGLKELRNYIAHPVKSIVRTFPDLEKLDSSLSKLYEFKERLDDYLTTL